MRSLTIVDWPERGQWIWRDLPPHGDIYDIQSLNGISTPRSSLERFTLYPARYLLAGLRVLSLSNRYDVVFSWEIKCGLAVALYQTIFRKRRPRHILVGFIYKGIFSRYPKLTRWMFSSLAGVICFTQEEADICRRIMNKDHRSVHFFPLAWDTTEDEGVSSAEWGDYILSVGSSNRDYETLIKAASMTKSRFIIVARPYNLDKADVPPNVEVQFDVHPDEVSSLIRNARLVVVPLHNAVYASGQNVILRAMSAGRAVIATRTPGTVDYLRHGETGLLVEPGNVDDLVNTLGLLLNSPTETQRLGARAREEAVTHYSFSALAARLSGLAKQMTNNQ